KNIRWTNENLLKLLKAGLVYDIDAVGANNYVSLILMSSVSGRCKFIKRYNLDSVFEDIQNESTNNLLLMNNIGLREFSDILEVPEWALGKDNTAIGKYLDHYGREMWIIVECPGDPYDLNIRTPRPERQITKKGYSFIKGQWFEMDIIGIAKQQGIDVDPKNIGKPRPCDDPFTIERLSPKVDMSGAPKYADSVV
ncbi:12840_t:CDS:1, partial [Dentiscutata heterogama]